MTTPLKLIFWFIGILALSSLLGYGTNNLRSDPLPASYVSSGARLNDEVVQFPDGKAVALRISPQVVTHVISRLPNGWRAKLQRRCLMNIVVIKPRT